MVTASANARNTPTLPIPKVPREPIVFARMVVGLKRAIMCDAATWLLATVASSMIIVSETKERVEHHVQAIEEAAPHQGSGKGYYRDW